MLAFEGRTSSAFSRQTLLTSYPAGNSGLPSNIIVPGGNGINTNGFPMAEPDTRNPSGTGLAANGYFYNVADLVNMWWFDGKYTFAASWRRSSPCKAAAENNSGQSYLGKVDSQVIGAQIGANITKNFLLTVGYDSSPVAHRHASFCRPA